MTDFNWYAEGVVDVAVEGIRAEARKWYALADRMAAVSVSARNQSLQTSAFAVTDLAGPVTAVDLKTGYDKMYEWLNALFEQAAREFDAMGTALRKNADEYQEADNESAKSFDDIARS